MKIKMSVVLFSFLFALVLINSCKRGGCGESKNSSFNGHQSHNAGLNCMNCHASGGEGEGCFAAAGTVYDSAGTGIYANTTVRLYSQPNGGGSVVATLQGDGKGNFYTTGSIDFGNGLYPAVTGSGGQTMYMSASTTTGACSSCHGVSQRTIYTF